MALDMTTALTIKAKVDGLQQLGGLEKGLGGVKKQTDATTGAMARMKTATGGLMTALKPLLPLLAVGAIAKFGKDSLDAADSISKMSQRTGVAAPMLDKFRKVAELSDTSIEGLGKGFKTLASNMQDAATKGTGPAAEAFRKLGVSITDSNGKLRASDQVMLDIADKFKQMADGPEKAALAADLFGAKIGDELIPMLNSGGDAVREMSTSMTQDFADRAAAFNDKLEAIGEKLGDMGMKIMMAVMPAIEQLVDVFTQLFDRLSKDQGFQKFMQTIGELAVGVIQNIAPAIGILAEGFMQLFSFFDSLPPGIKEFLTSMAEIGLTVAALAPVLMPIVGLLTGPLGIAVAIGAVIAIAWKFRDQIGEAFMGAWDAVSGWFGQIGQIPQTLYSIFVQPVIDAMGQLINWFKDGFMGVFEFIKQPFMQAWEWYKTNFIDPVIELGKKVVDWYVNTWIGIYEFVKKPFEQAWQWIQTNFIQVLQNAFQQSVQFIQNAWAKMKEIISSPFVAAINIVKGALNGVMALIEGGINGAIGALNRLIAAANRVPGVKIPNVSPVQLPRFADGGVVTGPTMALVGEGGEPEYIVPQSKASAFAANWMAGVRGPAAIPRFAEGGMVVPSASVSIQTGPVTQMNGTNYVTTQDLSRAVQAGVNQTLSLIAGDGSVRRQLGMA